MIFGFYNRIWELSDEDDFSKNIKHILQRNKNLVETIPQYINGIVVGWKIQLRYE